jgi:hypothetical protein
VTRTVPPLVGRVDAAEILGVHPNNIVKVKGLPAPLPGTGPAAEPDPGGMAVTATPLWRRAEIEALREQRAAG